MNSRALVLIAIVGLVAACSGSPTTTATESQASGPETVITDVLGREVTVKVPSARILVDGGRLIYTTAMLNKNDPTDRIVGWPDDLTQNDPGTLTTYEAKFPQIKDIPTTGDLWDGSFSVEQAIQLQPDVFVVGASDFPAAQDAGTIDQLERAGIPTVVVDYFVDPLKNTVPSVELLGRLFDKDKEATDFTTYYRAKMDGVKARIDSASAPPTPTFLWRAPGYFECCSSFAKSNLAAMVTYSGGVNLADDMLPGQQGTISPEAVLADNPAVIIATGANWSPDTPAAPGSFVPLGYDDAAERARTHLRSIVDRQPGFPDLQAVKDRRTYAVWHHFYDSPYNFLAVEWFAKWQHPELFQDIDPDAGLRELHEKFLPVEPTGTFWTELP
ncbi:ABC transporter substrate-binding protein [Mycolicibacterium arenosum]|uniref:ABC transporter substrate-binding protein n=1 Tax=Mycolicibacterium arenosum TaxID=2952157 RepID=A0ABT1MCK1_9MYCO|nr:ABC transporter substrate-binding protein [Mycolicibacterium sp. CAU 1645]MCP9276901.1 ABC transporter substrate-binding protein [Mycolicibacterium sp. CAU 1645]